MRRMDMSRQTSDLLDAGFMRAAIWCHDGTKLAYKVHEGIADQIAAILTVSNALYAFCCQDDVLYIGKTTQTLKKRLYGYCKPGISQITNKKCHEQIISGLQSGKTIDLFVFAPPSDFLFRGFEINLAGGLEDALIRHFNPPWNGGSKGVAVSESAILESEQLDDPTSVTTNGSDAPALGEFTIKLGPTYYEKGIVNIGKEVSDLLGPSDGLLTVTFSDGTPSVSTRIDRRANANGSVRFVGSNRAIADWFQRISHLGGLVMGRVLSANEVELSTVESPQSEGPVK